MKREKAKIDWKLSKDRKTLLVTLKVDMAALADMLLKRYGVANDDDAVSAALSSMTNKETTTLPLLANGKTNKEVAMVLGVSERTAKFHAGNIYKKMGVHGKTELMLLAGSKKSA